jgi:sec-independent protein translocase protein TatB
MFDIGFSELMLVGMIGLIILGPERLPKAARTVGLMIGRVKRTMSGIQQEIEQEVRNQEIREKLKDPLSTFLNDDDDSKSTQEKPQKTPEEQDHDALNDQLNHMTVNEHVDVTAMQHPKGEAATQPRENNSALKDK